MKRFQLNMNKKGFTLIELMIVIAIIGVLAAIAIPNFIAYRNRSFCSATENTARNVAAAVAEYYSVPQRTAAAPALADLNFSTTAIAQYSVMVTATGTGGITITALDPTQRCPDDYTDRSPNWDTGAKRYSYTMD